MLANRPTDTPDPELDRSRHPRSHRVWMVLAGLAVVALGIVAAWALVGSVRPHLYAGTVIQGNEPAGSMDGLVFGNGDPVDLVAYNGELVLVYFGYANCPDICPTTLSTVALAMESLEDDLSARTNLIMVSVDPQRDSLDYLRTYTEYFYPTFRGATGSVVNVETVATRYGVFYELGEGEDYTVDHTASLMGIGPSGALQIVWAPDVQAEQLADDIVAILR